VKKRGPVDKIFLLKQTLRNKIQEFVIGAFTVSLLVGSLRRHYQICLPRGALGPQRRGGEIRLVWGLSKGVKAEHGSGWGFRNFLVD
jgi:hypothetical protein